MSSSSAASSSFAWMVEGWYLLTESIRLARAFSRRSKRLSIYVSMLGHGSCTRGSAALKSCCLASLAVVFVRGEGLCARLRRGVVAVRVGPQSHNLIGLRAVLLAGRVA